ncbi:MAG: ATP-dependent RNA helicase HrpA [Candidatus Azotimanducaceae bacterium]
MNSSTQELDAQIGFCMIRDRFRLRKALRAKRSSLVKDKIDESCRLAEDRKNSIPPLHYPEELPITSRLLDIEKAVVENQVVIVAGETGSGKTTQIPKICLAMGLGVYGSIGHTQPRVVATRTVSQRIAAEVSSQMGGLVGYQVRFDERTSQQTQIKIMTDGILLAETKNDRFLDQYQVLIIDEAHERSLNIDFLLGYIKTILPKRPDLKIIVTSATIDVQRFANYFNDAPIIEVSGRTYPVDVIYRPTEEVKGQDIDQQIYQGVLEALGEIEIENNSKPNPGDVLVFLSGEREIRELADEIRKSRFKSFDILPLYSRLGVSEQNQVFQTHDKPRIVLATNVAETSLTVPGIHYVIDPGLARISRYSYRSKIQQLPVERVSQASAEQRKGRCGRVAPGRCIRLYSEEDFLSRQAFTSPEIMRTNLAAVILQMLVLRLGDIGKFSFIESPDQRQISDGFQILFELHAVNKDRQITRLGRQMARFPVDPRLSRMLLESSRMGCLAELIIITSALSLQDPRERPHEHQEKADNAHQKYWDEKSDFLAFINLWNAFEESRQKLTQSQLRKYCRSNFLSFIRMREWRDIHRQLSEVCSELNLKLNKVPSDYPSIHRALLSGLLGNIGQKDKDNEYNGARNRTHFIFPGSSQFKIRPKWIVSSELIETGRLYARCVAKIDSVWLEELADHLVVRTVADPFFDTDHGHVTAYENVSLYGVVIVNRRKFDFRKVNPKEAREIFIHCALVDQQLKSSAAFFKHNKKLIAEIEMLESKTRKRDILADNQELFSFYDKRLPSDISSVNELKQFLKSNEGSLFLNKEQLLKQKVSVSDHSYPDSLKVANAELKLNYQFDPEHQEDGVSISVPVAILRQVSEAQLDWVIPGLLREKCLSLLKSLPKRLRKNFVPAPEYVDKVVLKLKFDGRALTEVLAEQLFRLSGVKVSATDFNIENLDKHLSMNVRVVDDNGNILGTGRNLNMLRQKFSQEADLNFRKRSRHSLEKNHLTSWSFDELPEQVEIQHADIVINGYPALVDKNTHVDLEIFDAKLYAQRAMRMGLLRLIMLELDEQRRYVTKNLPGFEKYAVYYSTRGSRERLLEEMVTAIFRYTFIEDLPVVRNAEAFRERLMRKSRLVSIANEVSLIVSEVLQEAHEIERNLAKIATNHNRYACNDIDNQLRRLLDPGFLSQIPLHWLSQYPRYLSAIRFRMNKLTFNLERDHAATHEVLGFAEKITDRYIEGSEMELYRWMVEEFRISIFAQKLGTSLPVSAKRLEKQWRITEVEGLNLDK